jgi:hypothetical protein
MKLQSPPIAVFLEDFTVTLDLCERQCVFHYAVHLTRESPFQPWEIDHVDDYWIVRDMPTRMDQLTRDDMLESTNDYKLELVAMINDSDENFQRLQDAANEAVASMGNSDVIEE